MASDASAGDRDRTAELDELAARLDVAIAEAERKIESGRVYNAEHERVRQGWMKTLAYMANVRRQVTNDAELRELAERLDELEDEL